MKPRQYFSRPRVGRDAERLIWLAQGLAEAGSRVEDAYWDGALSALVDKLLDDGREEPFTQALEHLNELQPRAYDELADLIESRTESRLTDGESGPVQMLLIAMPILAWSRFGIPARSLGETVRGGLRAQLLAHVLADGVRLALADFLFSPDQLPKGYVETRRLAQALFGALQEGRDHEVSESTLPEAGQYISDVRYLLGAVAVPLGHGVFRWNEADGHREEALRQWRSQGGANIQPVMTGCALDLVLPDAYFAAWRSADKAGRPFSLSTAVAYLEAVLDLKPADLWAALAPFQDQRVREWRVGLGRRGEEDVLYGVVWPQLGAEDDGADPGPDIAGLLHAAGVGQVVLLEQVMPLEYCEDCGAPMFPNLEGEPVHAGMPDQEGTGSDHLH